MKSLAIAVLAVFLNSISVQAASAKDGPNIVFILTDDQDMLMDSLNYQPNIKEHLTDKGVLYQRHYCTIALCCPSRVSLLTGKAAHNTNVTDILPPYGGYPKFIEQGLNSDYLPVWLQNAGYNTYYSGKLMNSHTVINYDAPYAQGFNSSAFLLDPGMYAYWNSTWQTGTGKPETFPGQHVLDINNNHTYAMLDDAVQKDVPFFLTIAPVAPHAQVIVLDVDNPQIQNRNISAPEPQTKWNSSFLNEKVPRTPNFNPDVPSGASWIRDLPQLDQDTIDYNDAFYVARLQLLAGIDEMVGEVISRLDAAGLLDSTYIVYTTDNGFHIGQHRLQPGKSCPIEEDHIVPLIIRGPGVPAGKVVETVTTHTDLVPTFFNMLGLELRDDFDGAPIPVTAAQISAASTDASKSEHIDMEYWGQLNGRNEGNSGSTTPTNNTYKSVRVVGTSYSLYYTVWCDNSHELYDMKADPYQMNNLLLASNGSSDINLSLTMSTLTARLDALTMVLKSCKADSCRNPWAVLHPQGDVHNLGDAMATQYDAFYATQPKVSFSECQPGYIIAAEGPQEIIPYSH
ncbi:alkaline-phosphatase-like protein [Mycena capillaripes]|nr:alkaline-phosphatase-like protein [Mycena capillaripes]